SPISTTVSSASGRAHHRRSRHGPHHQPALAAPGSDRAGRSPSRGSSMSTDWNLYGSGRRHRDEWAQLHQATRGWAAAWADNRGFHLDAMPAEPPETTHLWAWAPGRWLRARIDTPHWWAALLTPTPPASASRSSASMRPSPVLGSTTCCPGATGTGASSTTGAG